MARWALIAGPKKSDRGGQALKLAQRARAAGYAVGGFVQLKRFDAMGRKVYDVLHLTTNERVGLARSQIVLVENEKITTCSLLFDDAAFLRAERWLRQDSESADILFLGDLSKVEVSGKGHSAAVRFALSLPPSQIVVLVARSDQLFGVVESFALQDDVTAALELPVDEHTSERFQEDVLSELSSIRSHLKVNTHGAKPR